MFFFFLLLRNRIQCCNGHLQTKWHLHAGVCLQEKFLALEMLGQRIGTLNIKLSSKIPSRMAAPVHTLLSDLVTVPRDTPLRAPTCVAGLTTVLSLFRLSFFTFVSYAVTLLFQIS